MTTFALSAARIALVAAAFGSLAACNTISRLSEVGSGPEISKISNPTQSNGYQQVTMPMPNPVAPPQNANSLWRPGSRAFFKDQRAKDVGDVLTVSISITNDSATFSTSLTRTRDNKESAGAPALMGYESSLSRILPDSVNPTSLLSLNSQSQANTVGSTGRNDTLTTSVAASITQVLPNGNLVINGRQEIRVNYELRELTVQGIIRPEDISSSNTVSYDKIAEARIYYGGRGVASDVAQPRYGQEILDAIFPF